MADILREIIFDTETTGLEARNGDRVIEIGAVELINRFPTGNTFHVYINPGDREVHPEALEIHGLSNAFLKDKPSFQEAFKAFDDFFSTGNLVAHNASFDLGFLNAELDRLRKSPIDQDRVVDTLLIARRKFPGQRNSLDALCNRFGIDNSHRDKHGALLDSELLAEVYIELMGGRQAAFALDHVATPDTGKTHTRSQNSVSVERTRPNPLPSRLTQEDRLRHQEYIHQLGDDPIWNKINTN